MEKSIHPVMKKTLTIMGVAKGSGMIRPDMATMLSYIITDADISSSLLKQALTHAASRSFNRITGGRGYQHK